MKKLMIAAAAAMIGIAAQAVTVNWTLGFICEAPEKGGWCETMLTGDSTLGYTAVLNLYAEQAMSTLVSSSSISAWEDGIATGFDAGEALPQADISYYGQLIVSNAKGQSLTSQEFIFKTWAMSDAEEITIANDKSMIAGLTPVSGEWDEDYGAFSASGYTAVPEPTSGLLLLLGVAGLALRRRRA